MVSLINFKTVNEDLQRDSREQQPKPQRADHFKYQRANNDTSNRTYVRVIESQASNETSTLNKSQQQKHNNLAIQPLSSNAKSFNNQDQGPPKSGQTTVSVDPVPNFVVTWRNLEFLIEPKWHQRLMCNKSLSPLNALTSDRRKKQIKTQNYEPNESHPSGSQQQQQSTVKTKIVLDKLDGSFRSGELTAILGPSGKCGYDFFPSLD